MSTTENRTSIGNTDQAEGLRTLFGVALPKVFVISSALSSSNTAALGLGTAHALKSLGHKVLFVDEIPISERHSTNGIPYPVQYDLGQGMANLVPLSKSIRQVDDNLWFAVGSKIAVHQKSRKIGSIPLDMRLRQTGLAVDYVVVVTNKPQHAVIPVYSQQANHILVTGIDEASSIRCISMMRELIVYGATSTIPILMIGGSQASEGQAAFERLRTMSKSYLEQSIELLSWVGAKSIHELFGANHENDTDLIIPSNAFDQIAKRISQ
jgi:methylmalonyl-CoA mutase cobalamin-binding subunit